MNKKDFLRDAPGRLVETSVSPESGQGVKTVAFIPDPLPPDVRFGPEVRGLAERALLALGELRAIIPSLPNPSLVSEPFMRREAVLSSRIEGTHTEIAGLYLFETARAERLGFSDDPESEDDAREVANYVEALEHGLTSLKKLPICNRLLREMHGILLSDVADHRGKYKSPGRFRRSLAFIGAGGDIRSARYVAPPAAELTRLMSDLEKYVNAESPFLTLVNIAIIHYHFEAVHPFADGNGRLGRLLISLMLAAGGILSEPLLYLSAYFERNRRDYYDGLYRVSTSGAWEDWVRFFLRGVEEESFDACDRAKNLLALREEYRTAIQADGRASSLLALVDALFEWPTVSTNIAKGKLGLSYQGAKKNIKKLEERGIISERTGRLRNRIYVADAIIELMS